MTRASELTRLLSISANYYVCDKDGTSFNGQDHSLRLATLAKRHDPSDAEMVFTSLVHDLARPLSDQYHGEVMAEIVRDLVSEKRYQVLRTHGHYLAVIAFRIDYDLDPNAPWHADALKLCGWEVSACDSTQKFHAMDFAEAVWYIDKFCGDKRK